MLSGMVVAASKFVGFCVHVYIKGREVGDRFCGLHAL